MKIIMQRFSLPHLLLLTFLSCFSSSTLADDTVREALAAYAWEKRQLIVFSPSLDHPEYIQFNRVAREFNEDFIDRRLQVWRVVSEQAVSLDDQPQASLTPQGFQTYYRVDPAAFRVLLIGYDQGEKLRQEQVDIDRLFGEIDLMPMRIQEMQDSARQKSLAITPKPTTTPISTQQGATTMKEFILDDLSSPAVQSMADVVWELVSDQVMGGVSAGNMQLTEKTGRQCLQLQGKVSTENNGGFLQLAYDLNEYDASAYEGIKIDVYGNGENYNLHLRTSNLWFPWQAYRSTFTAMPQWQTITLPFRDFRGYKTAKPLILRKLRRIGLVAIGKDYEADVCLGRISFF